jgi:phosphopantothenoylcysteine decarboxylase/phosphopantothenate--cysteine ligase
MEQASATSQRKTVVLGVTGSIAAYKSAELASLLVKQGHDVFVVMTQDAPSSSRR